MASGRSSFYGRRHVRATRAARALGDTSLKMRVLLVEDNPPDAELAERALTAGGGTRMTVVAVRSLPDALQRLSSETFDVVLLDLSLPGSSGLATLEAVAPAAAATPIVVLTGLQDEDVGAEALRSGAEDYLVKGELRPHALQRTLRYALERAAVRRFMRAQNQELESQNRDLDTYAHLLAHDLRAPLRAIANNARWLREDLAAALTPDTQQKFERLEENARSLGRMIETTLAQATRRETQEATGRPLADVVRDAVRVLAPSPAFLVQVETVPDAIVADWITLQRVVQNLVDNTIQHHDRPAGLIRILGRHQDGRISVAVEDDGPGIPPDRRGTLFDPRTGAKAPSGTHGFGLRWIHDAITRHGGSIDATPLSPRGTRFQFTWPLSPS